MYFIVSVKSLKPEDGEDEMKYIREKYLIDAMTVTEAEAKIVEWFPDNYKELEVNIVSMFDLDNVIRKGESEEFYLGRVAYPEEGKKGKIKMKSFQVMVNGNNLKEALDVMEKHYTNESAVDYEMRSISDSQIIVDKELAGV